MPRGLERRHDTWDLHFITFRCYQRQPLLARYKAMALFEAALEKSRRRYDFFVVGYWRWSSFEHYPPEKMVWWKLNPCGPPANGSGWA